jgi:hypothetical protein
VPLGLADVVLSEKVDGLLLVSAYQEGDDDLSRPLTATLPAGVSGRTCGICGWSP